MQRRECKAAAAYVNGGARRTRRKPQTRAARQAWSRSPRVLMSAWSVRGPPRQAPSLWSCSAKLPTLRSSMLPARRTGLRRGAGRALVALLCAACAGAAAAVLRASPPPRSALAGTAAVLAHPPAGLLPPPTTSLAALYGPELEHRPPSIVHTLAPPPPPKVTGQARRLFCTHCTMHSSARTDALGPVPGGNRTLCAHCDRISLLPSAFVQHFFKTPARAHRRPTCPAACCSPGCRTSRPSSFRS